MRSYNKIIAFVMIFILIAAVNVMAADEIYHLVSGEEYMDKTFVYSIKNVLNGNVSKTLCAEKDAPTYDVKKGLMTWVDYKRTTLESLFGVENGAHIRSIMDVAGPHLNQEDVIKWLEERTMLVDLTYDDVVSAAQYAIWFYSDEDFRIPSTTVGEDLYRYFVMLEPTYHTMDTDLIQLNYHGVVRDEVNQVVTISYSYQFKDGRQLIDSQHLSHRYSKNLMESYGGTETVNVSSNKVEVSINLPVTGYSMSLDFDIYVEGYMTENGDIYGFTEATEQEEEAQDMVGYLDIPMVHDLDQVNQPVHYSAHQLTLINDSSTVRKGFSHGRNLSLSDINHLSQPAEDFIGWFDENGNQVWDSVLMNRDRTLTAAYEEAFTEEDIPEGPPTDPNYPGEDSTEDPQDPGPNTPDEGNPNQGNPTPDNPDETGGPIDPPENEKDPIDPPDDGDDFEDFTDEETPEDLTDIPEEEIPFDGWFPNTGGTPFIIFMIVGCLLVFVGYLMTRKKYKDDQSKMS